MKLIIEYEIPEDYEDVHPDLIVSDFHLCDGITILSVRREPDLGPTPV